MKHHHLGDHQYYQQTDEHMEDHQYNKKAKKGFEIDLQYADDLSELNTNLLDIDHLKAYLPQILKERDSKPAERRRLHCISKTSRVEKVQIIRKLY